MLRMPIVGFAVILLTSGCFAVYQWQLNRQASPLPETSSVARETVKTDFISIAIFKNGKVGGYFTFRAIIDMVNPDKKIEIEYLISNFIYRNLDILLKKNVESEIFELDIEKIENSIAESLGEDHIYSFKIVDDIYDRRRT